MPPLPPPPDFRYVGLLAEPAASPFALAVAGASTGGAGAYLMWAHHEVWALVTSLVAAGVTAFALDRAGGMSLLKRLRASPTAMAIVPWGVLVQPDGDATRLVRWSGVRRISVDYVHTRDAAGTPSTSWSFVTVETTRERLVGGAAGAVALERLIAHLDGYAEESSRPVSLDLQGEVAAPATGEEPVARGLLSHARDFVGSSAGAERLSLAPASFREVARPAASEETIATLRAVLRGEGMAADPRALAALIAGDVGAQDLMGELLRLVTSANPMVAGCAKAAALKLGAGRNKAGALSEVGPFLLDDDLEVLEEWAGEGGDVSATG